MTGNTQDLIVFGIVVALRLFVPLAIPRFPLPAIVAAMIIDDADQTQAPARLVVEANHANLILPARSGRGIVEERRVVSVDDASNDRSVIEVDELPVGREALIAE